MYFSVLALLKNEENIFVHAFASAVENYIVAFSDSNVLVKFCLRMYCIENCKLVNNNSIIGIGIIRRKK